MIRFMILLLPIVALTVTLTWLMATGRIMTPKNKRKFQKLQELEEQIEYGAWDELSKINKRHKDVEQYYDR